MKRLFLAMAAIVSLMVATGCDNDDDNLGVKINDLPVQSSDFISSHFDKAKIVDVDYGMTYIEVEVIDNGVKRDVYFTYDGVWVMTSTDVLLRDVPQTVTDAVKASEYGTWRIEDVDLVDTPEGNYYLVEVEQPATDREFKLKVTADGTILP